MTILDIAIRKAKQSSCRFKVSAIGINHKGEVIGSYSNSPRWSKLGGGNHAEMRLMARYKNHLKTIYICRVGGAGELRPIDPCSVCSEKAEELGIKIISFKSNDESDKSEESSE